MTTSADVARLFLQDVGAPVSAGNLRAVEVWLRSENTDPTKRNNPLNLHSWGGLLGQTGYANVSSGDRNVAIFDTLEHGVSADANNLLRLGKTYPDYAQAVDALRADNPTGFLTEIAQSPWSGGHYRAVDGSNKLLNAYNGTKTYGDAVGSAQGGGAASGAWQPPASLVSSATAALAAYPRAQGGVAPTALSLSPLILVLVGVIIVAAVI